MRILIADDSDLLRRALVGLLSADANWNICGEARNGLETLNKARELKPDLLLVDINMPCMSGLEVSRQLRQELPNMKILVMSLNDSAPVLPGVLEAGGDGCIDKSRLGTDLVAAIRNIS
ncbi:MAG TPA: response regulator transcription factor [Candidatus Eremiobacteraceae bacterium]|nr:response regulator transcription factor [Candidatus Eremiobacteraceae bacterium]